MTEQDRLAEVHRIRMKAHWGAGFDAFAPGRWPSCEKEWRQTPHGAPWDTNVEMAKFHLLVAQQIKDAGLLDGRAAEEKP